MKRIFTLGSLLVSFVMISNAQGEMDAFNFSYNDLKGTARSVAMGGAFGALGGDISGVAINPAGIGVYKSSEIVTTLNFTNYDTKTKLLGSKSDNSKFNFSFDNIGIVGVVPTNSDVAPLVNFGFSYNRLKSFDRKISMNGYNLNNSLSQYIANRVGPQGDLSGIPSSNLELSSNPFTGDADSWLGAFAYNTGMIEPLAGSKNHEYVSTLAANGSLDNRLHMREKGSIDSYDFNAGTTFADMLSFGVTISVTDINYRMESEYSEDWFVGNNHDGNFYFNNWLKTEGTGWQVKTGLIFKPVNELRIGVAYHSPTWYDMTDYFNAQMDGFGKPVINASKELGTRDAYYDYKFRTPDKWIFSLAGVIGKYAILSADYELTNYGNMHYKDDAGYDLTYENADIKQDFRNASTLRVGAEVRATPQLSVRLGYMWQQSPIKDILKEGSITGDHTAATAGTVTQYSLVGDANYFTYGLGYKITRNFYADAAFVIKSRTDALYAFGGADKAELKNNAVSGVLTLGYRF